MNRLQSRMSLSNLLHLLGMYLQFTVGVDILRLLLHNRWFGSFCHVKKQLEPRTSKRYGNLVEL